MIIRTMRPEEAKKVYWLGIKTFHSMEALFMSMPQDAVVAVEGEKIIGAVMIKSKQTKKGKLGYLDYAFVSHKFQGKGIGKQLYIAAVNELKARGCTFFTGMAREDNTGSIRAFIDAGIYPCNQFDIVKEIKNKCIVMPHLWGPSNIYLSSEKTEKEAPINHFLLFFIANILLVSLSGILTTRHWGSSVLALITLLLMYLLIPIAGFLLGEKDSRYEFHTSLGGICLSAVIMFFGGLFLLNGKWVPKNNRKTKKDVRALAAGSILLWIVLGGTYAILTLLKAKGSYFTLLKQYSGNLLCYHMIPSYPFDEFGGRRIYEFSYIMYGVLWILTAVLLFFL